MWSVCVCVCVCVCFEFYLCLSRFCLSTFLSSSQYYIPFPAPHRLNPLRLKLHPEIRLALKKDNFHCFVPPRFLS